MTDDERKAIKARHDADQKTMDYYAAHGKIALPPWSGHSDRATLLAEVERLEGVIATGHDPVLLHDLELANKEVERLLGENYTYRMAQRACETCDAPTLQQFKDCQARLTRLLDALGPIATDMTTPECPANEVDDCETCQSFIQWGRKIQALIKEAQK